MSPTTGPGLRTTLALPVPFAGGALLDFLVRHAVAGVEVGGAGPDGGWRYARTLGLPGGPAVLALDWTPEPATLVLTRWCAPADEAALTARVGHLLALDVDASAAEAHLGRDPRLAPLLDAAPGLRVPGAIDPAETLLRTMLGQQVSLAAARTLGARLSLGCGAAVETAVPGLDRLFPAPATLAALDPTTLPMPRARARSLVEVAARLADGRLDLDADVPDVALRAALLACPGIGPWTADYVLMRVRHHPDVLLVGDLVIARELAAGGHADTAAWAPWRSFATMHLWHAFLQRAG